jgi:hypothetical protein
MEDIMKPQPVLAALAILMLLLAGIIGARPAMADSSVTVSVPGTAPWTDTGLSVRPGDTISITTSGTIFIAGSDPGKTPAGDPGCTAADSPTDTWVAPGLTCWSMIGRIGNNTAFEVGTGTGFTAASSGELSLGVNDNFFGDNSGAWTADITVTSGGCNSAPNGPQDVTNSATNDRGVDVTWPAPQPNCATVDHYDIVTMTSDGTPGATVMTVPATATTATVSGLLLCTFYRFGVRAVGADQQGSAVAPPTAPAFTQGLPDQAPAVVSIIIQGVTTSGAKGTFDPLSVNDYCTSRAGDLSALSSYPPLKSMTSQWLGLGDAAHAAKAGDGNNMIDSLASSGGLVLPFSYTSAVLTGTASSPVFRYQAYGSADVANSLPDDEAGILDKEIKSIHQMWPQARILVVGHSNGGLIAQRWWLKFSTSDPLGVAQVFSLDSPVNGVSVGRACTIVPSVCRSLGISPALASFYQQLWDNQRKNDAQWVSLDAGSKLFTPIGTVGDPLYDAADYPAASARIGSVSQVFYTEPSCAKSNFNLSSSDCALAGPSVLDSCGPLSDGPPPGFGVIGVNKWMHGVVMNCADVIHRVAAYMPGSS